MEEYLLVVHSFMSLVVGCDLGDHSTLSVGVWQVQSGDYTPHGPQQKFIVTKLSLKQKDDFGSKISVVRARSWCTLQLTFGNLKKSFEKVRCLAPVGFAPKTSRYLFFIKFFFENPCFRT